MGTESIKCIHTLENYAACKEWVRVLGIIRELYLLYCYEKELQNYIIVLINLGKNYYM